MFGERESLFTISVQQQYMYKKSFGAEILHKTLLGVSGHYNYYYNYIKILYSTPTKWTGAFNKESYAHINIKIL